MLDSTAAYDDRQTSCTGIHEVEVFQLVVDKVCDHDNSN